MLSASPLETVVFETSKMIGKVAPLSPLPPSRYMIVQESAETGEFTPFNPLYLLGEGGYSVEPFKTLGEAQAMKNRFLKHSDCAPDSVLIVRVQMEVVG